MAHSDVCNLPVTISAGESMSEPLKIDNLFIIAIDMPAEWTAADITFQAGDANGNYRDINIVHHQITEFPPGGPELQTIDQELTISVDASRHRALSEKETIALCGLVYLKLRSGTSDTPVAQAADRALSIVTRTAI